MEPMETSNYSIFSKMEKIYQIYRHFLWIALFLFSVLALCIMCWIFKFYIGLFFILSISLYTLFILSLWSFFVIISEYCERKNINLSNIFSSKFSIFLYIILLIFNLLFVLCGFSRLFIIINNIALASFNDFNCDFLNIYCIIIIILLLTTTVLSWINVFNKKAKVGKLNLLLVLIAIIGSSLLFYNILLATGIIKYNYFKIIIFSTYSSLIFDFISNFFNGLMGWELSLNLNLEIPSLFNFNNLYHKFGSSYSNFKGRISNFFSVFWTKYSISNNYNNNYNFKDIDYFSSYKKFLHSWSKGNIFQKAIAFIFQVFTFINTNQNKIGNIKFYNGYIFRLKVRAGGLTGAGTSGFFGYDYNNINHLNDNTNNRNSNNYTNNNINNNSNNINNNSNNINSNINQDPANNINYSPIIQDLYYPIPDFVHDFNYPIHNYMHDLNNPIPSSSQDIYNTQLNINNNNNNFNNIENSTNITNNINTSNYTNNYNTTNQNISHFVNKNMLNFNYKKHLSNLLIENNERMNFYNNIQKNQSNSHNNNIYNKNFNSNLNNRNAINRTVLPNQGKEFTNNLDITNQNVLSTQDQQYFVNSPFAIQETIYHKAKEYLAKNAITKQQTIESAPYDSLKVYNFKEFFSNFRNRPKSPLPNISGFKNECEFERWLNLDMWKTNFRNFMQILDEKDKELADKILKVAMNSSNPLFDKELNNLLNITTNYSNPIIQHNNLDNNIINAPQIQSTFINNQDNNLMSNSLSNLNPIFNPQNNIINNTLNNINPLTYNEQNNLGNTLILPRTPQNNNVDFSKSRSFLGKRNLDNIIDADKYDNSEILNTKRRRFNKFGLHHTSTNLTDSNPDKQITQSNTSKPIKSILSKKNSDLFKSRVPKRVRISDENINIYPSNDTNPNAINNKYTLNNTSNNTFNSEFNTTNINKVIPAHVPYASYPNIDTNFTRSSEGNITGTSGFNMNSPKSTTNEIPGRVSNYVNPNSSTAISAPTSMNTQAITNPSGYKSILDSIDTSVFNNNILGSSTNVSGSNVSVSNTSSSNLSNPSLSGSILSASNSSLSNLTPTSQFTSNPFSFNPTGSSISTSNSSSSNLFGSNPTGSNHSASNSSNSNLSNTNTSGSVIEEAPRKLSKYVNPNRARRIQAEINRNINAQTGTNVNSTNTTTSDTNSSVSNTNESLPKRVNRSQIRINESDHWLVQKGARLMQIEENNKLDCFDRWKKR